MARDSDSDSDYAFRLQMEEALAASLSSRSLPPRQRPPSPPIVARTGLAIIVEDDRNSSRPKSNSDDVRRGFDFRKAIGEGNSKGKGKFHENAATSVRNPNTGVGKFQNSSRNDGRRPSPVVTSSQGLGEESSKVNVAGGKFSGSLMYRLYFKGLVSEEIGKGKGKMTDVVAGFGVAICDQRDNLLFEMKGPLIDPGINRQGAEIKALTNGLAEALKLGIKHITFCCDFFPIFQFVTGKWVPKQRKISMLMDDLQQIRQQFSLSQPNLVAGIEVKFAYKLARESIVSQVNPHEDPLPAKASRKEECVICYNDIDVERMFSVDRCRHRFCFQCVKQHVEVKLLHGLFPKCPHDGCKSELVIGACGKLLTPKLSEMWKQRIKENSITVTDRIYCPYPRCSALMSKTEIAKSANSLLSVYPQSGVRRCLECRGLFCVDCKVPWHGNMSCAEYKKLHPNPPTDDVKLKSLANNKMWRQCGKCQHMIELTQGCNHITCRCGHEFCYNCGGGWNKRRATCTKGCPAWNEAYIMDPNPPARPFMAPNNHFAAYVAPNNHFAADWAFNHFDEDYEDEDYDDEDYDYNGYLRHFGHDMNVNLGNHMNDFDPFFDLPDGVIFTPDMLSPRTRQQLYFSDDSDDMDDPPVRTHTAPANAPGSREGQAEEIGQSPFSHAYPPSGNAPPNQQDTRNVHPRHDSNGFDPFFDLPDGVLFTPDMLSPRSLRRFDLSDDDSDDMDYPPVRCHAGPTNAPSSREGRAEQIGQSHLSRTYAPSGDAATVNVPARNVHPRHNTDGFDPFFDLPDGVLFTPDMLSPRSRRRFELSDDDIDYPPVRTHTVPTNPTNAPSSREGRAEQIGHSHLSRTDAPSGDTATVNAPATDHGDEYFGMHPGGACEDFYDSDEDDLDYDDYTDPYHPDYFQF